MSTPAADEFLLVRDFNAPRATLVRAWTERELLAQWWGPQTFTNPVCDLDLRPGGAYHIVMRGPDGDEYPLHGVYHDIALPDYLVMSVDCSAHPQAWHDMLGLPRQADGSNAVIEMRQTIRFEDLGPRSRLSISTRFQDIQARDAMIKLGMYEGWSSSLTKLDELLTEPCVTNPTKEEQ